MSPWLPTAAVPYAGSFVVDFVGYASRFYPEGMTVVHLDDSFPAAPRVATATMLSRKLVRRTVRNYRPSHFVGSIHVPIPTPPGSDWAVRAAASERVGAALSNLPDRLRELGHGTSSTDIHAHIGVISGSASIPWAGENRLFVYEHASFVIPALRRNASLRQRYERIIQQAKLVLCVNPTMVEQFQYIFPRLGHKMRVHPNTVRFDRYSFRERPAPLNHWLYIGNLKPEKGSRRLMAAFQAASRQFPTLSLTIVGRGPDVAWVKGLDLGNRVRVLPPVPTRDVPELMAAADVLVHLSEGETFGLTAIEAVASGMPVILTSTDGSEHVMRSVIDLAGVIVPQAHDPMGVVTAYEEWRAIPERLDLRRARNFLEDQYGAGPVAKKLRLALQSV